MAFISVVPATPSLYKNPLPSIPSKSTGVTSVPAPGPRGKSFRVRPGMRGYQAENWLQSYPSGAPRSTLGKYIDTPWLTSYVTGRPRPTLPTATTKQALMSGLRGLRGLGDDGSGDDTGYISISDIPDIPNVPIAGPAPEDQGVVAPSSIPYETAPINVPAPVSSGGYSYDPSTGGLIPVTASGQPASLANSISSVLNSLTRALTGSKLPTYAASYPAGTVPTAFGASLNQPLYAGSSLTTGNALAIGGGVVALVILMSAVKGSGGRRR
jgi:hypothetical protein